jgi:hypothetical protein
MARERRRHGHPGRGVYAGVTVASSTQSEAIIRGPQERHMPVGSRRCRDGSIATGPTGPAAARPARAGWAACAAASAFKFPSRRVGPRAGNLNLKAFKFTGKFSGPGAASGPSHWHWQTADSPSRSQPESSPSRSF